MAEKKASKLDQQLQLRRNTFGRPQTPGPPQPLERVVVNDARVETRETEAPVTRESVAVEPSAPETLVQPRPRGRPRQEPKDWHALSLRFSPHDWATIEHIFTLHNCPSYADAIRLALRAFKLN